MNLRNRTLLIVGIVAFCAIAWGFQAGRRGPAEAIRLGQDLKGGTTLRFALDIEHGILTGRIKAEDRDRVLGDTINVIRDRIDKYGLAETTITSLSKNKFEISLPAGSEGEAEAIARVVTALGDLQFRIEVLPSEDYREEEGKQPPRLQSGSPQDWPWPGTREEFEEFKKKEVEKRVQAEREAAPYVPTDAKYYVVRRHGATSDDPSSFAVLESDPASKEFTGKIVSTPHAGEDDKGKPVVFFDVKTEYQNVFEEWTGRNLYLPMAIVLNEEYRSAPRINAALGKAGIMVTLGETSYEKARQEARDLTTVLQTGSLLVRPNLESTVKVGAKLAGEARDRGIWATVLAFVLVLSFMIVYYRGGGVIANVALLLNVVLLLGVLAFFQAVLTLPGIAGIVLTIGVAVDANILINERMHEERRLGRTIRKAVSEGYDRALSAIVDSNLTSVIVAIFLYYWGSGPIRGFAVTLVIGLVASMFTAIFVTRTIFEWRLKTGRLNEITMLGSGVPPKIGWMDLRRVFAPISALGILFGLIVFFAEDRNTLYDIDFTGGYKLQARFTRPTTVDDVRTALNGPTIPVKVTVREPTEAGDMKDVTKEVPAGPYPGAEVFAIGTAADIVEINVQRGVTEDEYSIDEQGQAFRGYVRERLKDRLQPPWIVGMPQEYASTGADDPRKEFEGGLKFTLTLYDPERGVTTEGLHRALAERFPYYTMVGNKRVPNPASTIQRKVDVAESGEPQGSLRTFDVWLRSTQDGAPVGSESRPDVLRDNLAPFLWKEDFRKALEEAAPEKKAAIAEVAPSEPFPSLDVIGSSVAAGLRNDAIVALSLSLLAIIAYIAVRFKSRAMGLSAVLCLFHDVAFTLGIVAVANAAGLVDAKINLTMVAAFLTLVGFSVNDTVVIFDRIRENRGKKPTVTPELIDLSINQTFARSIKTNLTVFLVCLALFALNVRQRNVLEGFSFVLLVGTVIGSYSTVAIASPLLLFLPLYWERVRPWGPRSKLLTVPASHGPLLPLLPFAAILWLAWAAAFGLGIFLVGIVLFPLWSMFGEVRATKMA